MKKLMVAVAAVMLGIVAQAAQYNWDASVSAFASTWDPVSVGNVVFATGSQTWDFAFDGGTAAGTITGTTDGIFATGTKWSATVTTELFDGEGNSAGMWTKVVDFTMPSISATDPTAAQSALSGINDSISGAIADIGGGGTLPYASDAAAQGWAAAPEPTSGLLLLIGVAGLALKRKRA